MTLSGAATSPRRSGEPPQGARARGEHDVVGRHREPAPHRAQLVERARHAHVVAPRRPRPVEQRAARRRQHHVRQRACAAREPRHPRRRRESRRGHGERRRVADPVGDRPAEPRARRGRRRRRPLVAPEPPAAGLGIEHQVAELDHGRAVDHAVVHLADQPHAPVLELGGDRDLPQRAVARQRRRKDRVDDRVEIPAVRAQQVRGGIEVCVVDPHRVVHPERHARQLLPVARRPPHAAGDVREQLVEARSRPALGRIEGRHPADVHRRGRALHGQEGGVESGEALGRHVIRHYPAVWRVASRRWVGIPALRRTS